MRRVAAIALVACAIIYGAFIAYWYPQTLIGSIFCSFDDPAVERNYVLGYFGFPIVIVAAMLGAWLLYRRSAYPIAIVFGMIPPLLHVVYLLTVVPTFFDAQNRTCL